MASTVNRPVNAAAPVGNVSSALSSNRTAKPDPKKPGGETAAPDADKNTKPVVNYPVNIAQTPEERYKDRFGIIAMRVLPRAPRDQHLAALINSLQQYITETAIERLFITYLEVLLARPQLPYNPYPGFVRRLRQHAEGRLLHMKPNREIVSLVNQPLAPTRIDYLYKNRDCDYLWGLPSVLACCDKDTLKQYEWLVKHLEPAPLTMRLRNTNFSIQAIVALVGAAVFHGTFVESVPVIQVRVEYFIVGPSEAEAVDIFLSAMIADLKNVPKQTHVVMGVTVAVDPHAQSSFAKGKFWSMEEISVHDNDFRREALATILGKKYITAEMIFKTDCYMDAYKRGQKFYSFNFRQHTKKAFENEGEVSCYAELTEVSLHDGVFFNRGHAEAYITMFTPRLELIDEDKLDQWERPENKIERHSILQRYRVRPQQQPGPQTASDFPSQRELPQVGDEERDRKVRVDGFQQQVQRNNAPDASVVVDPIRSAWKRTVARLHPIAEIFEAMPYIIGLVLLDRDAHDDETLIQCYKIYRSSAARTWYRMKQNRLIREMIEHFEMTEDSKMVQHQFKDYKTGMKELLDNDLRECSSEMVTASRAIQHRLTEMCTASAGEGSNVPLTPKSALDLQFINYYCRPIYYQFVEDVQPECPKVFEIINAVHEEYPTEGPSDKMLIGSSDYFYGYEDERLIKQEKQVVDVQMCIERESAPSTVVIEAVIMKYLLDTRIDETWANYLLELVMKQHFPPNPYPRFISALRQSALKMAYWFEEDSVVVQRMYHDSPRLVDPLNFVFQTPGCDAFGVRSALVALDSASFFRISSFLQPLQNTKFSLKKDSYRAAVCMAIVGHIPYYGRLDPYLRVIELVDHIYLKGPSSCSNDGINLYSSIVRTHVLDINNLKDAGYVLVGVFLSGIERRWTLEEIIARGRNFEVEVENATRKRQPVYLKLFAVLDWRYITIVKHFRYHYLSFDEMENVEFFESNPTELYLSIFFEKSKAAFHYQNSSHHQSQDPLSSSIVRLACRHADKMIAQLFNAQDWIGVHRWFLAKALMRRSSAHVAEAWRVLHSKAAEINFLNAMNKAMQDLVYYAIERRQFGNDKKASLGALNEGVLSSTFSGYYYKLNEIMSSHTSLAPRCLASFLRRRLNSLVTRDAAGQVLLAYQPRTIEVLEEVRQSCLCVEQALAFDLHASCRDAQQELRAIIAELGADRPVVFEHEEDRTLRDTDRPQLVIGDHANEWHYDFHKPF